MPLPLESENVSVQNGRWGEDMACNFLRAKGYQIIERNVFPCPNDQRLEIDIIAYEIAKDEIVFVEVKQHRTHSPYESRLRSINRRKLKNLRLACNAYRRANHIEKGYRFDVVEIYGEPSSDRPEIDHLEDVRLFVTQPKFVKWS